MTSNNGIYCLDYAGPNSFDVFTRSHSVGIVSLANDGTWRHFYNWTATKGSKKKFVTIGDALANLHDRRMKLRAKRQAEAEERERIAVARKLANTVGYY